MPGASGSLLVTVSGQRLIHSGHPVLLFPEDVSRELDQKGSIKDSNWGLYRDRLCRQKPSSLCHNTSPIFPRVLDGDAPFSSDNSV